MVSEYLVEKELRKRLKQPITENAIQVTQQMLNQFFDEYCRRLQEIVKRLPRKRINEMMVKSVIKSLFDTSPTNIRGGVDQEEKKKNGLHTQGVMYQ